MAAATTNSSPQLCGFILCHFYPRPRHALTPTVLLLWRTLVRACSSTSSSSRVLALLFLVLVLILLRTAIHATASIAAVQATAVDPHHHRTGAHPPPSAIKHSTLRLPGGSAAACPGDQTRLISSSPAAQYRVTVAELQPHGPPRHHPAPRGVRAAHCRHRPGWLLARR